MTELKKHYITGAAKNAAESLAMAMHLTTTTKPSRYDAMGVQDLVKAVNSAAIALRKACLRQEAALKDAAPNVELTGVPPTDATKGG